MPDINKNEYEIAAEIVITVIQSGKMPSCEAEDIAKYYSVIYKSIHKLVNEVHKQATCNVELP